MESTEPSDSKQLTAPTAITSVMQEAIDRIDENTFADHERLFRRYRYFDFNVIQDVETGFINAGGFVKSISKLSGKKKDLDMFKRTEDYAIAIEITRNIMEKQSESRSPGKSGDLSRIEIEAYMLRIYHEGYGNDVRGTYVPFRVFQLVALWADKRHKLAILELLENINENANAKAISAYDEMKQLNDQLTSETKALKAKVAESEAIIQMKEQLIQKLTLPVNRLASPEAIYASPVGGNEFQLRYQKQPIVDDVPRPNRLNHINVFNAREVKDLTMKILIQQGLVMTEGGKRLIARANLSLVFSIIESVSKNEPISIPLLEHKRAFLTNELNHLALRIQTGTVVGKTYERRYELEHEDVIPWEIVPLHIINKYNETNKDNGFDAIILNETGDDIAEAIQIKHSSRNDYIREDDIKTFLNKCAEERYAAVRKRLILHNCRMSQALQSSLTGIGIVIDSIRD